MGRLIDLVLTGTTNGSGVLTLDGPTAVAGRLIAVEWIDGSLADGVDAVISCVNTSSGVNQTLLTLTNANDDAWYYPRALVHDATGTALTGTAGGDREMLIMNGTPRLAITSGGNAKTGGCILYYYSED